MVVEKSIHWKLNHRLSCWKSRAVSNMRKLLASENSNMSPTLFLSMEWPEVHWQKNDIIGKTVEPSLFLRQPSDWLTDERQIFFEWGCKEEMSVC